MEKGVEKLNTIGERFIFVGGSPRSGTTLMQNMLDSHPEISGGPEFLHLPDIIHLRTLLLNDVKRKWIDLYCSRDDVDAHMRRLVNDLLLPLADRHECRYLSEKTPDNVLVFSQLIELFPDARFIHIVRDPRAVVASLLKVGKRAQQKKIETAPYTANLNTAAMYVRKCLNSGFRCSDIFPDKVLTVTYEQLVRNPEDVSKKICNFLKLDWSPKMLYPGNVKHMGQDAITVRSNEIWYDKATYNQNPHQESIDKWKKTLSPTQHMEISLYFQSDAHLKTLGYDWSVQNLTTGAKVFFAAKSGLRRVGKALIGRLNAILKPIWQIL